MTIILLAPLIVHYLLRPLISITRAVHSYCCVHEGDARASALVGDHFVNGFACGSLSDSSKSNRVELPADNESIDADFSCCLTDADSYCHADIEVIDLTVGNGEAFTSSLDFKTSGFVNELANEEVFKNSIDGNDDNERGSVCNFNGVTGGSKTTRARAGLNSFSNKTAQMQHSALRKGSDAALNCGAFGARGSSSPSLSRPSAWSMLSMCLSSRFAVCSPQSCFSLCLVDCVLSCFPVLFLPRSVLSLCPLSSIGPPRAPQGLPRAPLGTFGPNLENNLESPWAP